MSQSWAQVLGALEEKVEQIESLGPRVGDQIEHTPVCTKVVVFVL